MSNLNKVLLMGNLTRAPQTKATPGGMQICEFGLAMNRRFKTQQGEDREEVCFVDVEVFGKQADFCARSLRKGSPVYLEGRLRFNQWTDRASGQNRNRLTITAEYVIPVERAGAAGGAQGMAYDDQGHAIPAGGTFQPPPAFAGAGGGMPAAPAAAVYDGPPLESYGDLAESDNG